MRYVSLLLCSHVSLFSSHSFYSALCVQLQVLIIKLCRQFTRDRFISLLRLSIFWREKNILLHRIVCILYMFFFYFNRKIVFVCRIFSYFTFFQSLLEFEYLIKNKKMKRVKKKWFDALFLLSQIWCGTAFTRKRFIVLGHAHIEIKRHRKKKMTTTISIWSTLMGSSCRWWYSLFLLSKSF